MTSTLEPRTHPATGTPRMSGTPVLGPAMELRRDPLAALERARRDHGDVVHVVAGPPGLRMSFYAAFHPDAARQVLAANSGYRKDNLPWQEMREILGDGLVTSQDEKWLRHRRMVQPLFTPRAVNNYADIVNDEVAYTVRSWSGGAVVDLHGDLTALVLQVIGRVLFGDDLTDAVEPVARCLPIASQYILTRGFAPIRTPRTWPTPANRRAARAQRDLFDMCDRIIARRRAGGRTGRDLLGLLLEARDGGVPLTDEEVRDQVLIFVLSGHETTGATLTFTLDLLARHPEHLRRVQEEVAAVLGDRPAEATDLPDLPYTTMVLKESMRLYPSIPFLSRRTAAGDVIQGHEIPPNSDVWTSPWVTHRHPEFWDRPETFDPERFTPEAEAARHKHAWFPFGGGPRSCIGRHLSMLEATLMLVALVRRYDFAPAQERLALSAGISLRPAGEVRTTVTPRR